MRPDGKEWKNNVIIVELCGIPGSGKSTLISAYLKKYPNAGVITRADLFPKNRILRNLQVRGKLMAQKCLKGKEKNPTLKALFDCFPNASVHSKVRIRDLWKRIEKKQASEKILLLEEGPIQYLSSLLYEKEFTETPENQKAIRDYYGLWQGMRYHVIYCDCSNSCSIERIKGRSKAAAFYDPAKGDIEGLLNVKRSNVKKLMELTPWERDAIDMEADLSTNADALHEILQRISRQ